MNKNSVLFHSLISSVDAYLINMSLEPGGRKTLGINNALLRLLHIQVCYKHIHLLVNDLKIKISLVNKTAHSHRWGNSPTCSVPSGTVFIAQAKAQ